VPESRAAAVAPSHPGAKAETEASEDQDLHIISSPIVGTFYRAPSPNADSFVKIGSAVEPDSVVCIIEAMKLMNEIQAETSGEVIKIYVENGQPVEYGQPLFGIKK
jgi:acetyl-CoA carboxylase biotin carboxyl carrier protein